MVQTLLKHKQKGTCNNRFNNKGNLSIISFKNYVSWALLVDSKTGAKAKGPTSVCDMIRPVTTVDAHGTIGRNSVIAPERSVAHSMFVTDYSHLRQIPNKIIERCCSGNLAGHCCKSIWVSVIASSWSGSWRLGSSDISNYWHVGHHRPWGGEIVGGSGPSDCAPSLSKLNVCFRGVCNSSVQFYGTVDTVHSAALHLQHFGMYVVDFAILGCLTG